MSGTRVDQGEGVGSFLPEDVLRQIAQDSQAPENARLNAAKALLAAQRQGAASQGRVSELSRADLAAEIEHWQARLRDMQSG